MTLANLIGDIEFSVAPLGAGGFITAVDISADGTRMLHCNDVYNGYLRGAADKQWEHMFRDDNLDEAHWPPTDVGELIGGVGVDSGTFGGRIAPSNKDRIYVSWRWKIWRWDSGTWSLTNMPVARMQSNEGASRRLQRLIDVHPTDDDIVIVGTNGAGQNVGAYYSVNGMDFTQISGLPYVARDYQYGTGKYLVAIDQGNPNYVYVHVPGSAAFVNHSISAVLQSGVMYCPAHGLQANETVKLATSDTLPAGYDTSTTYYVRNPTGDTFELSLTNGGAKVDTSDAGTGQHEFKRTVAGLYRSTTGVTGTFSHVAGSPATASCLRIGPDGTVFVVAFKVGQAPTVDPIQMLARGSGSAWTAMSGGSSTSNTDQIAVDPFDGDHIVAVDENGGAFRQTYDRGATWIEAHKQYGHWMRGAGEIGWFSNSISGAFPAMLLFDPVIEGKLWMVDGISIGWSICPADGVQPDAEDPWIWHDYSQGNEELIPYASFTNPDVPPILCTWDKQFWRMDHLLEWKNKPSYAVPDGHTENPTGGDIIIGHSVDFSIDDRQFGICVSGQGSAEDAVGYSINGGKNWRKLANQPPGFGGACAVSNGDDMVVVRVNNAPAYYTNDRGVTWAPVSFGGYAQITNWITAVWLSRQCVTADKTRPGCFAMLVTNVKVGNRPFTIDTTTNVLTFAEPHGIVDGNRVNLETTGALPTGIIPWNGDEGTSSYYARDCTEFTLKLAATNGGTAIDVSGSQSGTHALNPLHTVLGRNIAGVWVTEDGCQTWTHTFAGNIQTDSTGGSGSSTQFWQAKLAYVPGQTANMLYADHEASADNRLFWSQDDGATMVPVDQGKAWTVRTVSGFGFGKPLGANAFGDGSEWIGELWPAVYFYGKVNGVRGMYVSLDWFETEPELLAERPMKSLSGFGSVTGDLNTFGVCFAGIGGNGFTVGIYSKKLEVI